MIKNIGSPEEYRKSGSYSAARRWCAASGAGAVFRHAFVAVGTLEGHFLHRGSGTHRNRSDEFLSAVSIAGSEYFQVLKVGQDEHQNICLSVIECQIASIFAGLVK